MNKVLPSKKFLHKSKLKKIQFAIIFFLIAGRNKILGLIFTVYIFMKQNLYHRSFKCIFLFLIYSNHSISRSKYLISTSYNNSVDGIQTKYAIKICLNIHLLTVI